MPQFLDDFKNLKRVCDAGCGRGHFMRMLREAGVEEVLGIDMASPAEEELKREGFEVLTGDIFEILADYREHFDGISCSHLIEHFNPEGASQLLDLFQAALKPGGTLLLVTPNISYFPNAAGRFWRDYTHRQPYNRQALTNLVDRKGFVVRRNGDLEKSPRSLWERGLARVRESLMGVRWHGEDVFVVCEKKRG